MHKTLRSFTTAALTIELAFTLARASAAKSDRNMPNIVKEVRHELVTLPWYSVFDNLAFRVDPDGTVTLLVQVVRPTLKDDAERVVKKIPGVTRVINQIEVLPLSPNDDRIRMAEFRAIYGDPALSTRYGFRSIPPIQRIVT